MKILLVGMGFHLYEQEMIREFERQGCSVDFCLDADHTILRTGRLFGKQVRQRLLRAYQDNLLQKIAKNDYDRILVIVGRYLTKEFLVRLRNLKPGTKLMLYLWDDVKRVQNFHEVRRYYDVIYSFNDSDVKKYDVKFLPLFYLNRYVMRGYQERQVRYQLFSAMTDYSDRYEVVKSIKRSNPQLSVCIYLAAGNLKYVKRMFRFWDIHSLRAEGIHLIRADIGNDKLLKGIRNSRALLDIPFLGQEGLTIRTMEAVGAKRKLVTTNENVRKYDLYHPDNILVISRSHPVIDYKWLHLPFKELDQSVYEKYSVRQWVQTILTGQELNYFNSNTQNEG